LFVPFLVNKAVLSYYRIVLAAVAPLVVVAAILAAAFRLDRGGAFVLKDGTMCAVGLEAASAVVVAVATTSVGIASPAVGTVGTVTATVAADVAAPEVYAAGVLASRVPLSLFLFLV
jgi:hypothetical protein